MSTTDGETTEWRSMFDQSTCIRRGLCPVTHFRGQDSNPLESHSLYFEQHGTGPEKILFIIGLNSTINSWQPQIEYFAPLSKYSILAFDNRGVGNSGTPSGPYSTSGMAEDIIVLLDYMGWTKPRDIHVVSISLGGMIALELASRIPERMISLILAVTTAGGLPWHNLPPWKGLSTLLKLFTTKDPDVKVPLSIGNLFPEDWLNEKAANDPQGRTNREVQETNFHKRLEYIRLQPVMGSVSQMSAALTHRVSTERLRKISSSIPKVLIVTGDQDNLVHHSNSVYIKQHMPEAELEQWERTGHAIHFQHSERFNALIERVVQEGKDRSANEAH